MSSQRLNTTFVCVVFLGLLTNLFGQAQRASPPASAKPEAAPRTIRPLTVEEVLDWGSYFQPLLSSDISLAITANGPPDENHEFPPGLRGTQKLLIYNPNAKTHNRRLSIFAMNGKVEFVSVSPASDESLDVHAVLLRGWQFCFNTGSVSRGKGLLGGFFHATSRASTAELTFFIDEKPSSIETSLVSVFFYNPGAATSSCNQPDPVRNGPPLSLESRSDTRSPAEDLNLMRRHADVERILALTYQTK